MKTITEINQQITQLTTDVNELVTYQESEIERFHIGIANLETDIDANAIEIANLKKRIAELEPVPDIPVFFEGNFETVTNDQNKLYGWPALDSQIQNQSFAFAGSTPYAVANVINYEGKKVLRADVIDDDPTRSGQTRFQWSMFLKSKLEIIHFQYKIFLSPDIADLNNYPNGITWFTLFEMWNDRASDLTAIGQWDGSARWNLNLHKDTTGNLYWAWDAEYMQPTGKAFTDMHPIQKNKTAEIPLGRWFLLDIYFNRNGKTVVKADNNVIFDFTGQNIYPGRPELYPAVNGNAVNVFKIYTSDPILDWMRGRGKKVWAMYNDFKWFKF